MYSNREEVLHSGRRLLLAGSTVDAERGVWAETRCLVATELDESSEQRAFLCGNPTVFLVAPLLRVVALPEGRHIVVGRVRVSVTPQGRTTVDPGVDVVVQAVWAENGGWHQETGLSDGLAEMLFAALASPSHRVPEEPEARVAVMAKAFAEGSRNELARLRGVRYELERRIADLLAQRRTTTLRTVLAEVVELSMAVSRARDQAREADRARLYSWLWSDGEPAEASVHEAALRHCRAMDVELAEEDTRLHALLSGLSTLAVAQDGEAQQRFNLVAAAVAAGLGLPALILALYGADAVLPLDSWTSAWRALLPIGGTTLLAVLLALRKMPGRVSSRHYVTAVVAVLALVAVLFVAGALAPTP